jgi:hypothetical protein
VLRFQATRKLLRCLMAVAFRRAYSGHGVASVQLCAWKYLPDCGMRRKQDSEGFKARWFMLTKLAEGKAGMRMLSGSEREIRDMR